MHAAVCVYTLLNVYDPNKNPWITPEDASIE
ncbi:(4Fe-4S)-binding protein [Vicingaceae bacterium]|nr:(4Fe-4S)-binding protein [Vicingaceae bacterium]